MKLFKLEICWICVLILIILFDFWYLVLKIKDEDFIVF